MNAQATLENLEKQNAEFRLFLQQELLRRCKANPRYSLRAFARSLGVGSSVLSKLLSGKRGISPRMFSLLSGRLGLSPDLAARFAPGASRTGRTGRADRGSRSGGAAGRSRSRTPATPDYQTLTLDLFQIIADWYHYAILELTAVERFEASPKWIARTLGISVSEVKIAVERLERVGFLEITEKGEWIDRAGTVTTVGNDFTAAAYRKLQKQVLQMGIDALEDVPYERRDQSTVTLAVRSSNLAEAKREIREFRRSLSARMRAGGPLDEVYHFTIALYPVSRSAVQLPGREKQSETFKKGKMR